MAGSTTGIAKVREVLAADPRSHRSVHDARQHARQGRPARRRDRRLQAGARDRSRARGRGVEPGARLSRRRQARRSARRLRTRAAAGSAQRAGALYQLADSVMRAAATSPTRPQRWRKALTLDGDRAAFLVKLGEARLELKQLDAAQAALDRGDRRRSRTSRWRTTISRSCTKRAATRGPPPPRTKPRSRCSPKLYQPDFNLAKLLASDGRAADAVAHFRAAVEKNPEFGTGYLYLAKALLDAGDLTAAEQAAIGGTGFEARRRDRAARPLRAGGHLLAPGASRPRRAKPRRSGRHAEEAQPGGSRLRTAGAARVARAARATRRALLRCCWRRSVHRVRARRRHTPPALAHRHAHLLLITIDTLRADRLGAYGSTTVATPNLDRLAREGAMALHASAHVPLTRPSHVSLFTGLYPAEHGIRDNVSPPLGEERAGARRDPAAARVPHRCVRLFDRAVEAVGAGRGFRRLRRSSSRSAKTMPASSTRSRSEATSRSAEAIAWLARARAGAPLRVGAPVRSARSLRAARAVRVALRRPSVRRRSRVVGRTAWAVSTRRSRRRDCATTRCSSSRPITARGSTSMARPCTASSSTRQRSTFRSSCAVLASSRARRSTP